MKKLGYLFACAGVAFVFGACSSSGDGSPPPLSTPDGNNGTGSSSAGSVRLHEGTTVLSQDLANVANVKDDSIVFPASTYAQLSARKAGDILMSDRQADNTPGNNPDGFLRKVKAVSQTAEGTVVTTEEATLQEAVDDLKLNATIDMPDLDFDGPVTTQGASIHPLGKEGKTIKVLDYSGKNLFEVKDTAKSADGKTDIPYTIYAGIQTGTLGFTPSWDVKADVEFLKLNSFTVKGTGKLDAKLIVAAGVKLDNPAQANLVDGAKGLTKSYTTTLADYKVKLGSVKVGIVGFPTTVNFNATLNCDFNFSAPVQASIGASASGQITAGLEYADGKLTPSFDKDASFDVIPPAYSEKGFVRAYCTVTPKFSLKFFGSQALDLSANAFAGIGGSQTCGGKNADGTTQALVSGDMEAGLSAKVGATINIIGLFKWKKECTLFDISKALRYDATYPYPGGANATCSVQGPYPLPPRPAANPSACFGEGETASDGGTALIPGVCTHDVCTAGDKLGQACDECTMKVCAADAYCCDTFWGLSCFDSVEKYCGKKCGAK